MTPIEFAVKTLYWFFLYGFIGWGVEVVYAAVKTHASSSTAAFSAGRSARSTASAWWGWSTASA